MRVADLAAMGRPPPKTAPALPAEMLEEMARLYNEIYLPGLAAFFETRWVDFPRPDELTPGMAPMIGLFAAFLAAIQKVQTTDPAEMKTANDLEVPLVWALATLPNHIMPSVAEALPDRGTEARYRVFVIDALLSGDTLPRNPFGPTPVPPPNAPPDIVFWHPLAQYLLEGNVANPVARERCLAAMRATLGGLESRDVLYSLAVLRELAAQMDPLLNEQTAPEQFVETDPRCRLAVATRFMREEATGTGGTTNVVRRFAALGYRAFVRPGVNSKRPA